MPIPKHVAIGLTMSHMTGSSSIIGILNGLGHSVSHSTVLEHDTALANKQLCSDSIVPEGFLKKITTTVIWDNNDFREETPSGEGNIHNTNGLRFKGYDVLMMILNPFNVLTVSPIICQIQEPLR